MQSKLNILDNITGHFKLESIDKLGNVKLHVDEHNMIMSDARKSMSEIFANLTDAKYAHRFMLGTEGHKNTSIWTPKDTADGFVKTRDRMFSQKSAKVYAWGELLDFIHTNDILQINGPSGPELWKYVGSNQTDYVLNEEKFKPLASKLEKEPYHITIDFTLPRTNIVPPDQTNTDERSPYDVQVTQQDTSVTFVIKIPMDVGNGQYINNPKYGIPTSVFTEASLWVNDRIFSLKTFQGITKDDSIALRLTWTITF